MDKLELRVKRLEISNYLLLVGIIVLTGALINNFALTVNDGRMPVLTNKYIDDSTHFDYQDESSINHPAFSDKYRINFPDFYYMYSIGDVIIVFAAAFFLVIFLYDVYFELVTKKKS